MDPFRSLEVLRDPLKEKCWWKPCWAGHDRSGPFLRAVSRHQLRMEWHPARTHLSLTGLPANLWPASPLCDQARAHTSLPSPLPSLESNLASPSPPSALCAAHLLPHAPVTLCRLVLRPLTTCPRHPQHGWDRRTGAAREGLFPTKVTVPRC